MPNKLLPNYNWNKIKKYFERICLSSFQKYKNAKKGNQNFTIPC